MEVKNQVYQFDDIQLEPQSFKVWKAGQPLALEPKAFEVLFFLVLHRERLVEKQELMDAVWKEAFVTPNSLTRVIAQLRKSLGDDPKVARYIETVPTRGYRFVAEVRSVAAEPPIVTPAFHETNASLPSPLSKPAQRAQPNAAWLSKLGIGLLLILVMLLWLTREASIQTSGIARNTQLTTSPTLDLFPAFSPDGGMIAYSSLRNGTFEIFVRQLAPGGREIQITTDGAQNLQPTWSPDGKMIAYHSRKRHGIWIVPALGGIARQVTSFGARPAWSPDGSQIAFQSEEPADLSQAAFTSMPPSTLWLVAAQGGAPQPITQSSTPLGGHGVPTWSPDSRRLVFVASDIGLSELWTVTPQGGDLHRIRGAQGTYFDPVFAPDGQTLFFSTASGNFRIWQMRIAPTTGQPIGEPAEVANTGQALARHLTIAPSPEPASSSRSWRLAYSLLTLNNNISTVALDPTTFRAQDAPKVLTQDTNYRKNNHRFSPDGSQIAYNVWRMGADGEVWMMDADGLQPHQLTAEPAALLGWLPQGQQALLVAKNQKGTRILKLDIATGQQSLVGEYPTIVRMGRLSPDGQHLAYNARNNGTVNVWHLALADGATKQLTFDPTFSGFACWSPDSQWLAYETKRGNECHIVVMPRSGGASEQFTFGPGQSWPHGWSPDGDKIVFAGQREGLWNIWWVSRKTKTQQQITHYRTLNSYVRYPAWSPRGGQIVYEFGETTGNVWLAELK